MFKLMKKGIGKATGLGLSGTTLFAFKNAGLTYKSTDLQTFAQITSAGYSINDSVFVDGKLTVVGYDGVSFLVRSTIDGTTWVQPAVNSFGAPELQGIAYGNGKYVAISKDNGVYYSTDASNWNLATTPLTGTILAGRSCSSVVFGNGRFVAVGMDDRVITSTDGITWTLVTTGKALGFLSYANGGFFGGGRQGDYRWRSADGLNWYTSGYWLGGTINGKVVYANGKYFTNRSNGGIYQSTDGSKWTQAISTAASPTNIGVKDSTLVASASNGDVYVSTDKSASWSYLSIVPGGDVRSIALV